MVTVYPTFLWDYPYHITPSESRDLFIDLSVQKSVLGQSPQKYSLKQGFICLWFIKELFPSEISKEVREARGERGETKRGWVCRLGFAEGSFSLTPRGMLLCELMPCSFVLTRGKGTGLSKPPTCHSSGKAQGGKFPAHCEWGKSPASPRVGSIPEKNVGLASGSKCTWSQERSAQKPWKQS